MSRPLEHGIPWVRISVRLLDNPKIRAVMAEYGLLGAGVYLGILLQIYQQAPQPLYLTDSMTRYLANRLWMTPKKLVNITEKCVSVELFSSKLFQKTRELSTEEIRETVNEILGERERKRHNPSRNNEGNNGAENPGETPDSSRVRETDNRGRGKKKEEEGEEEPTPPTPPPSPAGELVGATLAAFQVIEENLSLSAADTVEAQNACLRYRPEWIRGAVKEACDHNKLTWKYTAAILRRWESEGKR